MDVVLWEYLDKSHNLTNLIFYDTHTLVLYCDDDIIFVSD